MDYELDIIPLLEQYQGMKLSSISGQTDITVENVDYEGISITCSDGQAFYEPHRRVNKVFNYLLDNGSAHVDAALENSGTRRNIPETLLANLPFIEHGKINNRKHLFLRHAMTHQLGTLQQSPSC
ncbi:hypothetical protein ERW51_07945 [Aliivibrio finisterrensis]|uniref:hypothetical protein n=1 Tax=Aliivibrio finisterrensis TaxID=511998 RepID=UPI0010212846|nr:hypothetical protein [Aliivibrio finisterrensis]RYU69100.1 hypothetical protein ERW54_07060 [Aliivibrio finisterrensis]RYU72519.1 hypothetical protein ERW51_07945 [Aliivibrio finisterrensis]RYU75946.1 hypothetical protein ERW48_06885 [Aliivibrio finisterrensis]